MQQTSESHQLVLELQSVAALVEEASRLWQAERRRGQEAASRDSVVRVSQGRVARATRAHDQRDALFAREFDQDIECAARLLVVLAQL